MRRRAWGASLVVLVRRILVGGIYSVYHTRSLATLSGPAWLEALLHSAMALQARCASIISSHHAGSPRSDQGVSLSMASISSTV